MGTPISIGSEIRVNKTLSGTKSRDLKIDLTYGEATCDNTTDDPGLQLINFPLIIEVKEEENNINKFRSDLEKIYKYLACYLTKKIVYKDEGIVPEGYLVGNKIAYFFRVHFDLKDFNLIDESHSNKDMFLYLTKNIREISSRINIEFETFYFWNPRYRLM